MYSRNLLLASSFAATCVAKIAPSIFNATTDVELPVSFGSIQISPATEIGINVPVMHPTIGLPSSIQAAGRYVLIMVDPDAPAPQFPFPGQFLHWLQAGLTFPNSSAADLTEPATISYARPTPPNFSVPHRYTFFLYIQPSDFAVPTSPVDFTVFNATTRLSFDVEQFAREAGLGEPLAANYFLCGNQTTGFGNATAFPTATAAMTGISGTGSPIPTFTSGAGKMALGLWSIAGALVAGAFVYDI